MNARVKATFMAPRAHFSINASTTAADLDLPAASESHTEPLQLCDGRWIVAYYEGMMAVMLLPSAGMRFRSRRRLCVMSPILR